MNAMAYAGRKSCGCLVAATMDRPEYKRDTAKTIAEWLRSGLTVERMEVEAIRRELASCGHARRAHPEQTEIAL